MSRRRVLTPPEITVWRAVAETITLRMPDAVLPPAPAADPPAPRPPAQNSPAQDTLAQDTPRQRAFPAPSWQPPAQRTASPGPGDVDRPLRKRVAGGRQPIEASLDLHGLRQADAHARLRRFLADAHRDGRRFVLVVTGKGGTAKDGQTPGGLGEERGVLRRMVPLWLAEAGLASIVIGFGEAGRTHGGAGALYVHLRNRSRRPRP